MKFCDEKGHRRFWRKRGFSLAYSDGLAASSISREKFRFLYPKRDRPRASSPRRRKGFWRKGVFFSFLFFNFFFFFLKRKEKKRKGKRGKGKKKVLKKKNKEETVVTKLFRTTQRAKRKRGKRKVDYSAHVPVSATRTREPKKPGCYPRLLVCDRSVGEGRRLSAQARFQSFLFFLFGVARKRVGPIDVPSRSFFVLFCFFFLSFFLFFLS